MSFGRMGGMGRGFGRLGSPLGRAAASTPAWVMSGASADVDFANNRAWVTGLGVVSIASLIAISRASNETDLLWTSASGASYNTFGNDALALNSGGLNIYGAATNLLLNSTVPATQTVTLSATGNYTLWVNGSGSAAIAAGTATITGAGTATNGTPVTINCTATGTVNVTVTGSLNAFQLESGTFGTPLIITAGVSATRAADNITLGTTLNNLWVNQTAGWASMRASSPNQVVNILSRLLDTNSGAAQFQISGSATNRGAMNRNSANAVTTANAYTAGTTLQMSGTWSASAMAISLNQGTVVSGTPAAFTSGTTNLGNRADLARPWSGAIQRLVLGSTTLSNAALQALSP